MLPDLLALMSIGYVFWFICCQALFVAFRESCGSLVMLRPSVMQQ
jgi:hypothetical protein